MKSLSDVVPIADLLKSPLRLLESSSARAVSHHVQSGLTSEVRVRGILLHPQTKGPFQWAQVWVATESEVIQLLELRDVLAVNGM